MLIRVRVTQLVDELSDAADRVELPAGDTGKGSVMVYGFYDSLDDFHSRVSIGCLEDFEIVAIDDDENPIPDTSEGLYAVASDDRVTGPYSRSDAFELADRGGGQPVPFSIVRHSVITYQRLCTLRRDLAQLLDDTDSAIAWAEGKRDR